MWRLLCDSCLAGQLQDVNFFSLSLFILRLLSLYQAP